jgi:hypothetical protein
MLDGGRSFDLRNLGLVDIVGVFGRGGGVDTLVLVVLCGKQGARYTMCVLAG